MDQLSQTKDALSKFISFCDGKSIQPTSEALHQFFAATSKPKLVIRPKIKQIENDYIVFTNNCRNNGFCVQEFKGQPSVFSDYINCPDSKLVVFISRVDCYIIQYKYYNVVIPKQKSNTVDIEFEANPEVEERLEHYTEPPRKSHVRFTIVHWRFNHQDYLIDSESQKVYQNNSIIGIRHKLQNQTYYIK